MNAHTEPSKPPTRDSLAIARRAPSRPGRWLLFLTALLIVGAWPPQEGRSLIVKGVNWLADPAGTVPVLPPQLGFGMGDDVQAVEARDELVRRYDAALAAGGLTRARVRLKVAQDPFDAVTERQLLLVVGVVLGYLVLRRW